MQTMVLSSQQDVAVPFMLNMFWEEDTLFMIFGDYFRFEPEQEDVEPVFVAAASLQEVVDKPVAGAAPTPTTSKLHVVSLLLSNGFLREFVASGLVLNYTCIGALQFLYTNPQPIPNCW